MEILDQPGTPDLRKADNGSRIVAMIIDSLVSGACWIIPIVGWFAGFAYILTRDALPFLDGQSVGKKAMGIRAVSEDGQPLTNNWGPSLIRNVVLFIPLFSLIELIVLLTNDKGLRLGDQWAKTKVISVK
jgi:uncharacterized RDD family membrane protein YckC